MLTSALNFLDSSR